MNRIGDRGFKKVAEYWMRDQERKGGWFGVYALGIHARSNQKDDVANCENIHAQEEKDGRWKNGNKDAFPWITEKRLLEQSNEAVEIGEQWKEVKRTGGSCIFPR